MHQPEIEELLGHLLNPPHHCSQATRLREEIAREVIETKRSVTLVPAQGAVQIDLTDEVGDMLAERIEDFRGLHVGHHAKVVAHRMLEHLRYDTEEDRERMFRHDEGGPDGEG
jgi:hypothetical protein